MKVLVVWTSLSRSSEGGYTFARGLTQALVSADELEVTLVIPREHDLAGFVHAESVEMLTVAPLKGMGRILRDLLFVQRWSRRSGVDLVVIPHEWSSLVRAVPVVNIVQNVLYLTPAGARLHPVKARLMRVIAAATARWADGSIAVSRSAADAWRQVTGRGAVVLPEGVDPLFNASNYAKIPNSVVIMTGPLEYKNPDMAVALFNALTQHPTKPAVSIVGVPIRDDPRAHGSLSLDRLAELFGRTAVVVMTSTVESFGLPAFEARAAGCRVVVCADTPMSQWMDNDDNVSVVKTGDMDDWLGEVLRSLEAVGGDTVRSTTFSWDEVGPRWVQALLTVGMEPMLGRRPR